MNTESRRINHFISKGVHGKDKDDVCMGMLCPGMSTDKGEVLEVSGV